MSQTRRAIKSPFAPQPRPRGWGRRTVAHSAISPHAREDADFERFFRCIPSPLKRASLFVIVILLFIATFGALPLASAQSPATAALTHIDASAFPEVRALVSVSENGGQRIGGLQAGDFQLLENNSPVAITQVSEEEIGLQLAFVIESSLTFSKRDAATVTRLDHIKNTLADFAVGQSEVTPRPYMKDTLDSLSIFAPEGPVISASSVGGEIRNALTLYTSDFPIETRLFELINESLAAVTADALRPGLRRVIVVFSSGIDSTADAEVSAIARDANAKNVLIHTVMVGNADAPKTLAAENLQALATLTGGSFRLFEGEASMGSLWELVVSQRAQYRLAYRSNIAQPGQHTLAAKVEVVGGATVESATTTFSLALQPPAITLSGLPASITRAAGLPGADPALIEPRTQEVAVQVNFPDSLPRKIVKLQLLVDGAVADEKLNQSAGGTALIWDLTQYAEDAAHSLQVIAVDELGLEGRSELITIPVNISIPLTPEPSSTNVWPILFGVLGIGAAGFALLTLAVAVAVALRQPASLKEFMQTAGQRVKELTEPFMPGPPARSETKQGRAYLERLALDGLSSPPIELKGNSLRLGRDETLVQIVLPERSVSRLHARIAEEETGVFFIHDEGSTSGTWVNYQQVPMSGRQLRHGDLINLGRAQMRFVMRFVAEGPAQGEDAPSAADIANATEPFQPPNFSHPSTESKVMMADPPGTRDTKQGLKTEPFFESYSTEAFSPQFDTPKEIAPHDAHSPQADDGPERQKTDPVESASEGDKS